MSTLHVKSIASLEALNGAMSEYKAQSDEPFLHFAPIFERKLQLLAELETHFVQKIEEAEQYLSSAQSAYNACMGDPNRISCSGEANMVQYAEHALQQARENLATYKSILAGLQSSFSDYQSMSRNYENHLQTISSTIVPNFSAFIAKTHDLLQDDGSQQLPQSGNVPNAGGGSATNAVNSGAVPDNGGNAGGNSTTETISDATPKSETKSSVSTATVATGGIALTAIVGGGFLINTLKKGKKGMDKKEIEMLQNLLLQKGYDVGKDGANGIFGNDTEKAVKKFQKDNNLKADGEVGNKTIVALKKDVYNVTYAELKKMFPKAKKEDMIQLESLLVTEGGKFGLTDKKEIALFLAQCGHESNGFKRTEEDFTYSAKALPDTFSAFKKLDETGKLKYDPKDYGYTDIKKKSDAKIEDIANIAYANELGNGDYASGDGYKFRGRGYIQLTGKDNYSSFNTFFKETYPGEKVDFIEKPDLIAQNSKYATLSSFYYWKNNIAPLKSLTVDSSTRAINPALKGLEDRKNLYEQIVKQLDIT